MGNITGDLIPGIAIQAEQRLGGSVNTRLQQPQGARSFESVLQGGGQSSSSNGNVPETSTVNPRVPSVDRTGTSGAAIEQLRLELMQRYNDLPPDARKTSVLLPELFETRSRLNLLREATQGARNMPAGTDLRGRFRQVEREWFDLERMMRSDKDLSTGELLGLQARLYQVSQHIEVMSKVVDQMTSGVKTILNTNV